MNEAMDQAILKAFPLLAATGMGLPAQEGAGMRFIAASDGLYREINLPWANIRHRIARTEIALPYGVVEQGIQVHCSTIPKLLIQQFRSDCIDAMPCEMACAMIWNSATDQWRYAIRPVLEATPSRVRYTEVERSENEHIVVDLHSHGVLPAFFSAEDDADDRGTMRFSGVLGNVTLDTPSTVLRLNMPGISWPARWTPNGNLEVAI